MRKLITFLVLVLALGVSACASAETVFQLGTCYAQGDISYPMAEKFAELVAERTNGAYKIEIHPNGELAMFGDEPGEPGLLKGMSMNLVDMGIVHSGSFVSFSEMMGVLGMPYLFATNEEVYKVLDGEIGKELLATLEEVGLKGLAYGYQSGTHIVTNSVRPVTCAADLTGLKLSVQKSGTVTFETLGVNVVQQGTIDGQESTIGYTCAIGVWEDGEKYATLSRHCSSPTIITMSLNAFNSLDGDTQAIFMEAAKEATECGRVWNAEQEASQIQTLKDNGMEIVETPDIDSFRAAMQPVYDAYPQYADFIVRIQAALAE